MPSFQWSAQESTAMDLRECTSVLRCDCSSQVSLTDMQCPLACMTTMLDKCAQISNITPCTAGLALRASQAVHTYPQPDTTATHARSNFY